MGQLLPVLLFVLSFVLIFKGGDLLVESAIWLSRATKISPLIIGATVVSLATTLPETCVSLIAVRSGDMALATSNAFGAMICNFALILGIAFTFLPSEVDRRGFKSKCFFVVLSVGLIVIFAMGGRFSIFEGVLLFLVFVTYIVSNIVESRRGNGLDAIANYGVQIVGGEEARVNPVFSLIQLVIGAATIAFGSSVLVSNSVAVGNLIGADQRLLGLTLIAVGTGLPELVTTISSIKRNNAGIGIGNMLGANIINGTMLVGLCSIFSKGHLHLGQHALTAIVVLVLVSLVAIVPTMLRGKSSRWQGIALLSIYVGYVLILYFT